ncbi:MAG: glycosyltransferase, partial [Chloroflexi bacterium]|nr:glycosyltransferase [Chloroflexota bacterium]
MNVSVIIPSYNAEKTLADTLRCLQLQTFTEWEAIVIDDGSQDNTAVIAQTFAEKDERIRLITQPNGGVSAARNHGLRVAQNDFLLFLDADDWISSDHLEEMTNALKVDTTLDAVQCGSMYVMPSGALVDNSYFIDDAQLFNTFARTCVFCIHACVIRRTLVLDLGGFDDTLVTCEDWDLWQRAARTGARFGKVQKVMSMYRMRPGSASENGFRMLPDGLKVIGRGHGSDPRVKNPAPEFANGRSPQNLDNAILSHICWTAGLAIGKGKNPLPMFELVRDYHAPMLDPHEAASALFEAVLLPTCQTRDGWLHLWPKLKNNIIQFFDALEAQSRADGFSARAQNMLEQLIIHHAVKQHHPITIGRTHGVTIDVSQAIRDVAAPSSAERLFVLVTIEGDYLGTLMLPLFDRFMSNHVLIDAIANKFSWSILERFFWHTIYYKLRGEETSDGVKLWRDDTLLAQGLPEDYYGHIHGYAGWTLFLQELWRRPFWIDSQFYDATIVDALAETLFVENGQVTIEVSEP